MIRTMRRITKSLHYQTIDRCNNMKPTNTNCLHVTPFLLKHILHLLIYYVLVMFYISMYADLYYWVIVNHFCFRIESEILSFWTAVAWFFYRSNWKPLPKTVCRCVTLFIHFILTFKHNFGITEQSFVVIWFY